MPVMGFDASVGQPRHVTYITLADAEFGDNLYQGKEARIVNSD